MSSIEQFFQLIGADTFFIDIDHVGGRDRFTQTTDLKRQLRDLGVLPQYQ